MRPFAKGVFQFFESVAGEREKHLGAVKATQAHLPVPIVSGIMLQSTWAKGGLRDARIERAS
jgi:hypothetical protein